MSRNYSPNHPTMRGRDIPPTLRQRTATVRARVGIDQPAPNYKLRAGIGFLSCIGGLFFMESSAILSVCLLTVAGYLWINGINGAAKEWEDQ